VDSSPREEGKNPQVERRTKPGGKDHHAEEDGKHRRKGISKSKTHKRGDPKCKKKLVLAGKQKTTGRLGVHGFAGKRTTMEGHHSGRRLFGEGVMLVLARKVVKK